MAAGTLLLVMLAGVLFGILDIAETALP